MQNKRNKIIYVAGPYTAKTKKEVDKNIDKARKLAIKVWQLGFCAICPHLNTYHFDDKNIKLKRSDFVEGDVAILEHCDGILMVPGWEKSNGTLEEHEFAVKHKIPIFLSLKDLEKWEKTGLENAKALRLASKVKIPRRKKVYSFGEWVFFSLIGFILSVLAGVYIAQGDYLIAFVLLNILLFNVTLILARLR